MAASPYQLTNTDISGSNGLLNIGNKTSGVKSLLLSSLNDATSVIFESNGVTKASIEVPNSSDDLLLTVSGLERLRITPAGSLLLNSLNNGTNVVFQSNGTTKASIGVPNSSDALLFTVANLERLRITSIGRVGIGISSPNSVVEVNEAGNATTTYPLYVSNNGTGSGTKAGVRFNISGIYRGSVIGGVESDGFSSVTIDSATSTGILKFTKNSGSSELARFDSSGRLLINKTSSSLTDSILEVNGNSSFGGTGYLKLPPGTTAQRPTIPSSGMIRFNTTTSQFEGYNGVSWGQIGAGATGEGGDSVFFENHQTVTTSYTITSGKNAMSSGPITIASGVTVTVPSGSTWVIV